MQDACLAPALPPLDFIAGTDLLGSHRLSVIARAALAQVGIKNAVPPALATATARRTEKSRPRSASESELDVFFEDAVDGVHRISRDGVILWANKADYSLLGCTADEVIGRSITEFHVDRGVIVDMLHTLPLGQVLENFHARLRCKDGTIKHVLITSNACFEDGQFVCARCFTCDVTRLWQADQALRDADRRKDEFLAVLAHELRNPLAPITNAVELLERDSRDLGVVAESLGIIKRQVQQMTRLIDDLMDVSRISQDKIELRKERVELVAIVNRAIETSRPLIEAAGHVLTVDLPAESLVIDADPTRLAQVIGNLLNNSAKYTNRGGTIHLQVRRTESEVVVRVRDNGIGIARGELAHVFDMFKQVDRSLERSQGGLGIGLALVRRLVELHGGGVDAHSAGPSQGSEVVVRLPLAADAPHPTSHRRAPSAHAAAKRRVLVVDDDKDAGSSLNRLLTLKGHEVCTASDGLEALAVVEQFAPDVILMDVGMPRLNGYEATRQIRQMPAGRTVVIVALTGWGQFEDVQRCVEAGFSAHMIKPVDFAALDQLLANPGPRNS